MKATAKLSRRKKLWKDEALMDQSYLHHKIMALADPTYLAKLAAKAATLSESRYQAMSADPEQKQAFLPKATDSITLTPMLTRWDDIFLTPRTKD